MKIFLLSLTLLCGACSTTDGGPTGPADSNSTFALGVKATAPQSAEEAMEALPRFNHLDRAKFAVRAWVRDRS